MDLTVGQMANCAASEATKHIQNGQKLPAGKFIHYLHFSTYLIRWFPRRNVEPRTTLHNDNRLKQQFIPRSHHIFTHARTWNLAPTRDVSTTVAPKCAYITSRLCIARILLGYCLTISGQDDSNHDTYLRSQLNYPNAGPKKTVSER